MIEIDLRNIDAARLGTTHGIELAREFAAWGARLEGVARELDEGRDDPQRMLGWIGLPEGPVDELQDCLRSLPDGVSDLVVLGIGGSSLGALTVVRALQHPFREMQGSGTGMRVHFVDNVDPDVVAALLETLDPRATLVNVISKSGSTAETMAAYLAFKAWLEAALGDDHARQIVVTTDPERGVLRPLAREKGYAVLPVPPTVGGRFSVLSNVGLLPIALAGVDVAELLAGAQEANRMAQRPLPESPVLQAALVQYLAYRRGKRMSVLMPYSSRLSRLGDWFVQLWAESLGKAFSTGGSRVHEGSTPISAMGATDQHSQVQLFNEGPNDKIIAFVRLSEFDRTTLIPDSEPQLEALSYLAGESFNRLINAEQAATAFALAENGRPNYTLTLPALSARSLGGLLQFLMWQTAIMGALTEIDAFDQPGVELGKIYTYALMGRPGFDEERERLRKEGIE